MRNRRADVQEGFCTNRFSFRYSRSSKKQACVDSAGQCVTETIAQTTTIRAVSSLIFEADPVRKRLSNGAGCFEVLFPWSMVHSAKRLMFCCVLFSGPGGLLLIGVCYRQRYSCSRVVRVLVSAKACRAVAGPVKCSV